MGDGRNLTVREISETLGVTKGAVITWIREGKLKARKQDVNIKREAWTVTGAELQRFVREEKFYGKHPE